MKSNKPKYAVIVMILINIICWKKMVLDVKEELRRRNPEIMAQEIENALNEVESGWEKKSITVDYPVTYSDVDENTIVYHCLVTTHYEDMIEGSTEVNFNAISGVIEILDADSIRNCNVNDVPAVLCEKNGRAYLSWTLSSEYSFVIEYTPEAVLEEDIFRMAQALYLP